MVRRVGVGDLIRVFQRAQGRRALIQIKPGAAKASVTGLAASRFDYTAKQNPANAGLDLVNLTQLLIALPVGLVLLWAAWWLHRKMFRRPGERMSVLDAMLLVLMAGMGLLIALSLWTSLG